MDVVDFNPSDLIFIQWIRFRFFLFVCFVFVLCTHPVLHGRKTTTSNCYFIPSLSFRFVF